MISSCNVCHLARSLSRLARSSWVTWISRTPKPNVVNLRGPYDQQDYSLEDDQVRSAVVELVFLSTLGAALDLGNLGSPFKIWY